MRTAAHASAPALGAQQRATLPDLQEVWGRTRDAVELPTVTGVERSLHRLGLSRSDALLISAAPALRGARLSGLALVLSFAVVAAVAGHSRGATGFLLVAPLVPVLGVALSYGRDVDPALEQEAATPYPPLRLVFLRSAAVLTVSLPMVAVAGAVLPGRLSYLWLLPAAGFTAVVLGLSTWLGPARPALGVTVAWMASVWWTSLQGDLSVVFTTGWLVLYGALGAAGALTFCVRTHRLGTIGGTL